MSAAKSAAGGTASTASTSSNRGVKSEMEVIDLEGGSDGEEEDDETVALPGPDSSEQIKGRLTSSSFRGKE